MTIDIFHILSGSSVTFFVYHDISLITEVLIMFIYMYAQRNKNNIARSFLLDRYT